MDIWVENLFKDHRKLPIPGFLIRSTAPINVEDEFSTIIDSDRPTIQTVIDCLYQNSKTGKDLGLVIALHGYNTGFQEGGRDGVLEGWYQPLCTYINDDSSIHKQSDSLVFLGYRWPSESLKRENLRKEALKALPLLLGILLYGGLIISISCLVLSIITHSFITILFAVLGIIPFSIIFSLFLLRISLYFRDSYRATQFGVPDLVELIRQLDHGLVQRKVRDALTDEVLYTKISNKIQDVQDLEKEALIQIIQTISHRLSKKQDLEIDPSDSKFQQFIKTLRHDIPFELSDEVLIKIIERLVLIEAMENDIAMRYWRQHSIKLSFIGHSMGGQVTAQVIRILSDIFDPRSVGVIGNISSEKNPSSRVGRVFRLGRLILVAPDIPVLTITSGRSNFLRSALRRFEEAYLFSNEGDLALRIASTAANYFSFPAKTRTQGYRLGNVTVCPKNTQTLKSKQRPQVYGILNLDELSNSNCHLLEYLEISVLNKDKSQKLDPTSQKIEGEETVASDQEDQELIADLFTYFDCTEYRDRADYNPDCQSIDANVLILDGQRSPLKLLDYIRLFIGFATFSPRKFPKGGRDVHGGYFLGKFCKFLMYRLAFLGLQKFLDSLLTTSPEELGISIPLPDDLKADLARILELEQTADPTLTPLPEGIAPEESVALVGKQLAQLRQRRLVALDYLSWICEQKQIQAVFSPERYQVDILKSDREEVREQMLMRNTH